MSAIRASIWLVCACLPSTLPGQQGASASNLRRVVADIAHDSMAGRATPSPQLDAAASYVAAHFKRLGLKPLGDDGEFFQRYPLTHTTVRENVAGIDMGELGHWRFGTDYWHIGGMGGPPFGELRGPLVVVNGDITRQSVASIDVKGKIVIYRSLLQPNGVPAQLDAGFVLGGAGARAVLVASGRRAALWPRIRADRSELKPRVSTAWTSWLANAPPLVEGAIKFMPLLEVWEGRLDSLLKRAGKTVEPSNAAPIATPLGIDGRFHFDRQVDSVAWAPNVLGVLHGSDPALRHEYIVVTAHLDGLGVTENGPPPPKVLNGADDNASGIAALVEMARLIAAGPAMKRSVIFAAVSGEELGLWGSEYLVTRSPVPVEQIVANVNIDMVGRARGDSLYFMGAAGTWFEPLLVPATRSAGLLLLDQTAMDARWPNERLDQRSDHVNFRRKGIPTLNLFTGLHDDYHETTDDVETLNYPSLVKITDFAAVITRVISNASRPRPPRR